jgi:orotate phosphoribosyltransferase
MTIDTTIAKLLLESGVATFKPDEPFRFTTGILSPVYMDHRVLISQPDNRKKVATALEELAHQNYQHIEVLAGTSTAGIPWAAWISAHMNIPMVYVRGEAKKHGKKKQVEGVLTPGSKTVIVEDLISTGVSSINSVNAIREAGGQTLGVIGIFSYGLESSVKAYREADVSLHTLTNFRTLVDVATQQGMISPESQEQVFAWAENPAGWGKKMGYE